MKAIRYARFGRPEVLDWVDVERPFPLTKEVLVKIAAAAVNPKDCLTRKGKFRLLSGTHFPRSAGYDFSGTVVECGRGSDSYKIGDAVFGMLNDWTGGAYAEFAAVPERELAPAPKNVRLEDSSGLPLAALTSLQALRDLGQIRSGMRVLINGASGGVGTLAIQLAKSFGASVTAVCSTHNAELAQELGADETVDYVASKITELDGHWDIFYDVFGNQTFAMVRHLLLSNGVYITTVPSLQSVAGHVISKVLPGRKARLVLVKSNTEDLRTLAMLVEQGVLRPVTDRRFRMADAAEAHRYVETRRARGKVLLIP